MAESTIKVVGRRREPASGLKMTPAQTQEDARAWKKAFGLLPIPKGVYRFHSHQEADEWLLRMLTRP